MKLKKLKKGKKKAYKSRYQAGGMYGSNTVSSAGQGNVGNTSSIVYQESNPAILEEKLKAKKTNEQLLIQQSSDMATKVEQIDAQAEVDIATAKQKSDASFAAGESVVKSGLGAIKKGIDLTKSKDKPTLDTGMTATGTGASQVGSEFVTKVPGSELGTSFNIPGGGAGDVPFGAMGKGDYGASSFQAPAPTAPVSAPYVPPTSKIPVATSAPTYNLSKSTITDASGNIVGAKGGIGAGIKAYKAQRATNQAIKSGELLASSAGSAGKAGWGAMSAGAKGNIIGTAATLAGEGLKKWGGDDDDTELNTAEWSGELLSGAGTGIGVASTVGTIAGAVGMGAAYGSAVPGLGTAIGAVAGLGYGAYKALAGRRKARRAEAASKAERSKKVNKYNKELTDSFLSHKIQTQNARLKSKRYSGYDLGTNYRVQTGGMRMGMPRYGYAS